MQSSLVVKIMILERDIYILVSLLTSYIHVDTFICSLVFSFSICKRTMIITLRGVVYRIKWIEVENHSDENVGLDKCSDVLRSPRCDFTHFCLHSWKERLPLSPCELHPVTWALRHALEFKIFFLLKKSIFYPKDIYYMWSLQLVVKDVRFFIPILSRVILRKWLWSSPLQSGRRPWFKSWLCHARVCGIKQIYF